MDVVQTIGMVPEVQVHMDPVSIISATLVETGQVAQEPEQEELFSLQLEESYEDNSPEVVSSLGPSVGKNPSSLFSANSPERVKDGLLYGNFTPTADLEDEFVDVDEGDISVQSNSNL